MNMNKSRNATASEVVEELKATGGLDELFARIDSGDIELTGDGGLVPMLIKETLERGLRAEMTSHLGTAQETVSRRRPRTRVTAPIPR